MSDEKMVGRRPSRASKGAALVYILVFAFVAYFTVRAPDYSAIPVPAPAAPVTPAPFAQTPVLAPVLATPGVATLPGNISELAASALNTARQWRPDAQLVQIDVQQAASYIPVFSFVSPADNTRMNVMGQGNTMTTSVMAAAADPAAPSKPIILRFIDLPAAVDFARAQGMAGLVHSAMLRVALGVSSSDQSLVWTIQPDMDRPPYLINAVTGLPVSHP